MPRLPNSRNRKRSIILIKKKKTEEELATEAQEFPSIKEASAEDSVLAKGASAPTMDAPKVGEPTASNIIVGDPSRSPGLYCS